MNTKQKFNPSFIRTKVIRMLSVTFDLGFTEEEINRLPKTSDIDLGDYKISIDNEWEKKIQALVGTISKAFGKILYFPEPKRVEKASNTPETTEMYIDFTQEELEKIEAGKSLLFSQLICNQELKGAKR